MPGSHHVPGATSKENRMYEHIKQSELKSGKSEEMAKRIGAATVNEYRTKHGETKTQKQSRHRAK